MKKLWNGFTALSRPAQLGRLLLGVLLLFHAWLLARRLDSGQLFDSAVGWRWLGAFGLLLFWRLQRHLARPLSSRARRRSNLAFWVLALVLHSGVPAADPAFSAIPLTELGNLGLPLLAAFLLLETLGALVAARTPALRRTVHGCDRPWRDLQAGFLPQLSCRPPPSR